MTVRSAAKVASALVAKGMDRNDSGHHVMLKKSVDGKVTLVTRISHSSKEIGDNLAGLMARQCALRPREFWALVDCTLSQTGWDGLVRVRCPRGQNPYLGK